MRLSRAEQRFLCVDPFRFGRKHRVTIPAAKSMLRGILLATGRELFIGNRISRNVIGIISQF